MECPICYNIIIQSGIGSCTHHFCMNCLIKWCNEGGINCPICKELILFIRPDKEFDALNALNVLEENENQENEQLKLEPTLILPTIKITFIENSDAGITLENNCKRFMGIRIPGVKVKNIDKNKICYLAGLRKHNIILFVNNIPCIDHEQVIRIIDNIVSKNGRMTLIMAE